MRPVAALSRRRHLGRPRRGPRGGAHPGRERDGDNGRDEWQRQLRHPRRV